MSGPLGQPHVRRPKESGDLLASQPVGRDRQGIERASREAGAPCRGRATRRDLGRFEKLRNRRDDLGLPQWNRDGDSLDAHPRFESAHHGVDGGARLPSRVDGASHFDAIAVADERTMKRQISERRVDGIEKRRRPRGRARSRRSRLRAASGRGRDRGGGRSRGARSWQSLPRERARRRARATTRDRPCPTRRSHAPRHASIRPRGRRRPARPYGARVRALRESVVGRFARARVALRRVRTSRTRARARAPSRRDRPDRRHRREAHPTPRQRPSTRPPMRRRARASRPV